MNQILEKLALDLINFNKIDERKNKNKKRDHFMYSCFKIFIILAESICKESPNPSL